MTALLILNYHVTDPQKLDKYRQAAAPVLAAAGGTRLAKTTHTKSLDEAPPAGDHTVIWQFPDVPTAREVYESADYQALRTARIAGTTPVFAIIVDITQQ